MTPADEIRAVADQPTPDTVTEATEDPIIRARLATALREHGMVHLGNQVPADEYDCCADAVIEALRQHRGEICSPAARETELNNQGQPRGGVLPPSTGATEERPPPVITTGLVVQPYRTDRGDRAWVFRCWGTGTCDGWLSLDHYSQQSAERARERHVAEEHQ